MSFLHIKDLPILEKFLTCRVNCKDQETKDNTERAFQVFQNIWLQAPPEWRLKIQRPAVEIIPTPPRDRLRIDLWCSDTITIPEALLTQLKIWHNDPSSFFNIEATNSSSRNPFERLFGLLHDVCGGDEAIKLIRLRLGQISLYRLKTRLGRCKLRANTNIEEEFLSRISLNNDKANSKVALKWASKGGKYDSLATDLGGLGSMICIPEDVTTAKLERIPQQGPTRKGAIDLLRNRGVNDKSVTNIKLCYDVADKIWEIVQSDADSYFLQHGSQRLNPVSLAISRSTSFAHTDQQERRSSIGRKRKSSEQLLGHERRQGKRANNSASTSPQRNTDDAADISADLAPSTSGSGLFRNVVDEEALQDRGWEGCSETVAHIFEDVVPGGINSSGPSNPVPIQDGITIGAGTEAPAAARSGSSMHNDLGTCGQGTIKNTRYCNYQANFPSYPANEIDLADLLYQPNIDLANLLYQPDIDLANFLHCSTTDTSLAEFVPFTGHNNLETLEGQYQNSQSLL